MAQIRIKNLSFGYDDDLIFENLNLSFDSNWKLGMIGRNGRGKTTLLRLLNGELHPQEGMIESSQSFTRFPFAMREDSSVVQIIRERVVTDTWRTERELNHLKVSLDILDRPVSLLSGGEKTKLQLALLFSQEEPAFLLIDEPTNHLDALGRRVVGDYLAGKQGFLMVSHDRAFLDRSVDHILSLNKGGMMVERGNYSSFAFNQKRRDEYEIGRNEKLTKEIVKLEESQREKRMWSDKTESGKIGAHTFDRGHVGHLAAKAMKRAQAIQARQQRILDEKKELLHDIEYASELKIETLPHDKKILLSCEDLSLGYGGEPIVKHLNFQVKKGERVAITGPNGCGKSTLMRAILGEIPQVSGELRLASRMTISYVSQDISFLHGDVRDFARNRGADLTRFLMLLRKLDFPRREFEREISSMSEGQKKKLLIAASLCTPSHLYLWDEPLNFIDVLSRIQIEELIAASDATVLLVEHDESFLARIGARTQRIAS